MLFHSDCSHMATQKSIKVLNIKLGQTHRLPAYFTIRDIKLSCEYYTALFSQLLYIYIYIYIYIYVCVCTVVEISIRYPIKLLIIFLLLPKFL